MRCVCEGGREGCCASFCSRGREGDEGEGDGFELFEVFEWGGG